MKIVQICGLLEGAGITRYMIEMRNAFISAGYEVESYVCQHEDDEDLKKNWQTMKEVQYYDYTEKSFKHICEADIVCIHQLMPAKADKKYRDPFMQLLKDINGPKKVFFINGHNVIGYKFYGIDILEDKEFLMSFDRIATFYHTTPLFRKIKETIGEDEAMKRFIQIHHPYKFDEDCKDKWLSLDNKANRVTYIGRWAQFKNPMLMQKLHKVARDEFEFEMRGILPMIGVASVPDLFYEMRDDKKLSFKEKIIGPSQYTYKITAKWKREHGVDTKDLLLDYPHGNRMFIFGPYKRDDGMKAIAKSKFGVDFYYLKDSTYYGDNVEYAQLEIIEQGAIPMFDLFTAKSVNMYVDGKTTNTSIYDNNLGVSLSNDMSNVKEVIEQMKELAYDEKKYNDMRERCFEAFVKHTDPQTIGKTFVDEVLKS